MSRAYARNLLRLPEHHVCVDPTVNLDEAPASLPAFEDYVQARWARLVRTAVLLGVDPHTAEDVVQTVLARCYFRWDRIVGARDPEAYVHRVLINAVKQRARRRWTGEVPWEVLPEQPMVDAADRIGEHRLLLGALSRLPVGQREAIVLRYYADFTEAQAAAALDVALGTVKSRCARALATLAADPSLQEGRR